MANMLEGGGRTPMLPLPELGRLSHGQIAALVGVATYDRQSCAFKGRSTIGGRTLRSAQRRPHGRPQRRQLQPKSRRHETQARRTRKGHPVALINKLMTWLNAIIKNQTQWPPNTN